MLKFSSKVNVVPLSFFRKAWNSSTTVMGEKTMDEESISKPIKRSPQSITNMTEPISLGKSIYARTIYVKELDEKFVDIRFVSILDNFTYYGRGIRLNQEQFQTLVKSIDELNKPFQE